MPANPIEHRVGNYMHAGDVFKRKAGKSTFIIGFATAYNAYGLIGSECNGIFVLNDTKKDVVLDEHMKLGSGWGGATKGIYDELSRLKGLSSDEFMSWIKSHPRAREQYR